MTITVVADEGTFPEGTQMRTTYVNPGSVMGAIEGSVEGEIKKVKAVDITFRYKEQEIQPEKAVKVTISASGMDSSLDHEILHIDDHKNNVVETVVDKGDMPGTKGTFHVDGFSIYAVVETGETGEDARLAVNFVKADGSTATQLINQRQIGQIDQYIFDPGVGTAEVQITITAASQEWTYDGAAHQNTEVTVTSGKLLEGDKLVAKATGSVTNVADTAADNNPIAAGYKIMHGGEDVTANYVITPEDGTLTVNPKAVTVTARSEEYTYDGTAHSLPEYDVTGLVGDDAITAVVTGSITFPSQSPVTNELKSYEFTKGTPGNYSVTTKDGKLTMKNAAVKITITAASQKWTYDGITHANTSVTVTEGGLLTGDELVAAATGSVTNVEDTAAGNNPVADGYKIMHDNEDVTANYEITPVAGTLTVKPRAVTVTAQDKAFAYDGEEHSWPEYDVDGLVGDDEIKAVVTGSITFPKESPVTNKLESYEFKTGIPGNYSVTTADGELTMTNAEAEITITAADDEWTYDGKAHQNTTVTLTEGNLFKGDKLVAEATGSVKNVADTAAGNNPVADGYKIMHGEEDVTDNYAVTCRAGKLTINPKAVTITAQDQEFTYDGTAKSWPEYDVDGLVGKDSIEATVTGSIRFPSQSPVTNKLQSYKFTKGKPGNYTVTTTDGRLTMTNAAAAITITAASQEWTYDGKAHQNTAVTVTEGSLFTGDTLAAKATGKVTNVADTAKDNNPIAADYRIMHDTEDVTENYVITTAAGTLTINPKEANVTADNKTKVYDGKEETDPVLTATETGLVGSDDFRLVYTLSREAGQDVGQYVITPEGDEVQGNYNVTYNTGIFEITKSGTNDIDPETGDDDEKMDAESKSITVVYDGKSHTVSAKAAAEGSTIEYQTEGGSWSTTAPSRTDVGTTTFSIRATHKNYEDVVKTGYKLIVEPREIKVTTGSATKVYDGEALTNDTVDVEVAGLKTSWLSGILNIFAKKSVKKLVEGESITVEATGSQTEVGSNENTYIIEWDNAKESNYTIVEELGTLTVTAIPGTAHMTVKKVTTSKTPKGGYSVGETIEYKITVTNDGDLNITDVVVTDELTGDEWTVESLTAGQSKDFTAKYTVTEADEEAGEVVNVATAKGTSTDPDHPEVPVQDGTDTEPVAPVKPEPATYDIRYKLNGGTYEGSKADIIEKYPEGTVIGIHDAPEREGYDFDYWKGSAYQPGDEYTVTGDHVFTAQWKKIEADDDDDDDHHKATKRHKSGSPRTGDDSNTTLWLAVLLLAAAGAAGTAIYRRKNRK